MNRPYTLTPEQETARETYLKEMYRLEEDYINARAELYWILQHEGLKTRKQKDRFTYWQAKYNEAAEKMKHLAEKCNLHQPANA